MRHGKKGNRLGRDAAHRLALTRNLVTSLFQHGRVQTTSARAKHVRPVAEKLVTLAKRGDLHARRIAAARLRDEAMVRKLFEVIGPRYAERNGGYTRVLRAGFRYGDNAPVAVIELVDRDESAKGAEDRARHEAEQEGEPEQAAA